MVAMNFTSTAAESDQQKSHSVGEVGFICVGGSTDEGISPPSTPSTISDGGVPRSESCASFESQETRRTSSKETSAAEAPAVTEAAEKQEPEPPAAAVEEPAPEQQAPSPRRRKAKLTYEMTVELADDPRLSNLIENGFIHYGADEDTDWRLEAEELRALVRSIYRRMGINKASGFDEKLEAALDASSDGMLSHAECLGLIQDDLRRPILERTVTFAEFSSLVAK
jgi:hypothetical protein